MMDVVSYGSLCAAVVFFFLYGYRLLHLHWPHESHKKQSFADQGAQPKKHQFHDGLKDTIQEEAAVGNHAAVVAAWRAGCGAAATPLEVLRPVLLALLTLEPDSLVSQIVEHCGKFPQELSADLVFATVVDAVGPSAGHRASLQTLFDGFLHRLRARPSLRAYVTLARAYAAAGDEERALAVDEEVRGHGGDVAWKRHVRVMQNVFAQRGMLGAAFRQIKRLSTADVEEGQSFTTDLLAKLVKGPNAPLNKTPRLPNWFAELVKADLLEESANEKNTHVEFAAHLQAAAPRLKVPFPAVFYEGILKCYASAGDPYVLQVFREVQSCQRFDFPLDLCQDLILRAGTSISHMAKRRAMRESHGSRKSRAKASAILQVSRDVCQFMQEVAEFAREGGGMTMEMYRALARPLNLALSWNHLCELYRRMREDGFELDDDMYPDFVRATLKADRPEISQELQALRPGSASNAAALTAPPPGLSPPPGLKHVAPAAAQAFPFQ